ncbi:MAG: protein kinase [Cyanobacteria bacterium]|nr:protein kinase [Cyanobacteriota bacterium]
MTFFLMDHELQEEVSIKACADNAPAVDFAERQELSLVEIRCAEQSDSGLTDTDDEALHAVRVSFAQTVLGEAYEVLDVIGHGGMGAVYKVKDASERILALKLLKPELCHDKSVLKRFQQEAAALAELNHPYIVGVYDHGITEDGAPYLVMPYLDGGTLADIISAEGKVEPRRAIQILLQVCQALSYAHDRRFVHRDIKPSNVMIEESVEGADSTIQIVDFGIAKIVEATGGANSDLTHTGDVFGTPSYMSPEQCQGEDVDSRSDIYSAGCMLYEMITGRQPFHGANAIQVAVKQVSGDIESFSSNCPDGHILVSLEQIVRRCMRKSREERYQSIDQLTSDLKRVESGKEVAYEESGAGAASNAKSNIFRIGTKTVLTLLAGFWYVLLFAIVVSEGFNSETRIVVVFIATLTALVQRKWAFALFTQRRNRRSLRFWCNSLIAMFIF